MNQPASEPTNDSATQLTSAITSLASSINKLADRFSTQPAEFVDNAIAYRWQNSNNSYGQMGLVAIEIPQLIAFDALHNIDRQARLLYNNTQQFVLGFPANNALMTGARGTGKSSLVRACLTAFQQQNLRLIEVEKAHLADLPTIVNLVRDQQQKFIVFCDDLSFEEGEHSYKGLKTVLDGSLSGPSANVLIYATSNRKHMITERMSDNLETGADSNGEIHPGDSIEEKISLSERFGLQLNFYSFSQPQYLNTVDYWLEHYGLSVDSPTTVHRLAIQWATQRGSRSGRVAMQFARDYVGKQQLAEHLETTKPKGS